MRIVLAILLLLPIIAISQDDEMDLVTKDQMEQRLEERIREVEDMIQAIESSSDEDDWSSEWTGLPLGLEIIEDSGSSTIPDGVNTNDMLIWNGSNAWVILTAPTLTYTVLQLGTNNVVKWDWVRAHAP